MFEKSFVLIDEFNNQNMGAKSNNLKYLKDKLGSSINVELPQSGCISLPHARVRDFSGPGGGRSPEQ